MTTLMKTYHIGLADFRLMSVEVFFGLLESTIKSEDKAVEEGTDHRAWVEAQIKAQQGA